MSETLRRSAVFLDRDGTIIVDLGYRAHPRDVELLPGASEGLRRLAVAGFLLVIVTNQSGIGRGLSSPSLVEAVNNRLRSLLASEGIGIAGWYVCPHHPDARCRCRKPAPGLALQAAHDLELETTASFVIGDRPTDLQLATSIGARGILISRDGSSPGATLAREMNAPVAADLVEASDLVSRPTWRRDIR